MEQINASGYTHTVIHLVHTDDGKERIACMPHMTEFHATQHHGNYQRSNDLRAVTCPACLRPRQPAPPPPVVQAQPQAKPQQHINQLQEPRAEAKKYGKQAGR